MNKEIDKKSKKIINKQNIFMNNYKKSYIINDDFIIKNIYSNDEIILNKIYNLIDNPYQKKLNIINLVLNSELKFSIKNNNDIILFFNWLSPLNIEYNMSSKDWNYKYIINKNFRILILQNSIGKIDINNYFYSNYIDLIKNILLNSNIKYNYFEFKSKRFTKVKDIIWTIEL